MVIPRTRTRENTNTGTKSVKDASSVGASAWVGETEVDETLCKAFVAALANAVTRLTP